MIIMEYGMLLTIAMIQVRAKLNTLFDVCLVENLCAVSVSVHNMLYGFSGKICPLISEDIMKRLPKDLCHTFSL